MPATTSGFFLETLTQRDPHRHEQDRRHNERAEHLRERGRIAQDVLREVSGDGDRGGDADLLQQEHEQEEARVGIPEHVAERSIGMRRAAALELRPLAQAQRGEEQQRNGDHGGDDGARGRGRPRRVARGNGGDEAEGEQQAGARHEPFRAEQSIPLDVARRELGAERAVGHHVERVRGVEADDRHGHPRDEPDAGERRGRRPEQDEGRTRGQRGRHHPRAAPAEPRARAVRCIAHERIRDRVPHAREPEHEAHRAGRDPEHVGPVLEQVRADDHEHETVRRARRGVDEERRERKPRGRRGRRRRVRGGQG